MIEFEPVYKSYIWGGSRIKERFQRPLTLTPLAEAWEIASHPEGTTLVTSFPFEGKRLSELNISKLLGRPVERFPLLIKLLDAKESLSIQVHPSKGEEQKEETWYILEADKGAKVWVGWKQDMDPKFIRSSIENNTMPTYLNEIKVSAHDVIHIPAGVPHAIGGGCLILEVQQSANTTYRLYDWGRDRPPHIEKACEVMRKEAFSPKKEALPFHAAHFTLRQLQGPLHRIGPELLFSFKTGKVSLLPYLTPTLLPEGEYLSITLRETL